MGKRPLAAMFGFRSNEKVVIHPLSYEHLLGIAEEFLSREVQFLAAYGHERRTAPNSPSET